MLFERFIDQPGTVKNGVLLPLPILYANRSKTSFCVLRIAFQGPFPDGRVVVIGLKDHDERPYLASITLCQSRPLFRVPPHPFCKKGLVFLFHVGKAQSPLEKRLLCDVPFDQV